MHCLSLTISSRILASSVSVLEVNVGRKLREKSQVHLIGEFFISILLKLYFASNVHQTHLPLHPFFALHGQKFLGGPQRLKHPAYRACPNHVVAPYFLWLLNTSSAACLSWVVLGENRQEFISIVLYSDYILKLYFGYTGLNKIKTTCTFFCWFVHGTTRNNVTPACPPPAIPN